MKKNSKPSKSELRRQAEKKLSRQKQAAQPEQGVDALRLVHELEVHQIELEMQNEELVQARAELEAVLRQYTDLYDFAPTGYFTLTREGAIRQVNLAGANLLGVNPADLTRRRLGVFVSNDSRPAYNVFFEQLLTGQGKINCELAFEKKEGGALWGRIEATCFEGSDVCRAMLTDITERKQTEEALRTAGQQWQDTFNAIGDSIALMDTDGIIIRHNRAMSTWIGKPACEIDGHLCHEVVHGHSEHIKNCPFQRMKKSKHREKLIFELNGRQINATVDPILNSDGKIIGATHIISDITERLQMQKALQSSESSLKAIFENSQQSFVLIDKNRTIQSFNGNANKNAKALFGHEIQPGESIYKIISPQEHAEFDENFERALAGDTIRVEKMFEVETGALWFEFHYAPVLTHREISGVFLSTFNITERKLAEELLKESEWRNRIISELTTDYIFVVDVDADGTLRIRWASDNFSLLTGRKIEDVATSNVWGNIIHPDDKVRFFDFINQVLSTAKTDKIECRTISPHGGERWVRVFVRPQAYEGNKVSTVIGAVEDITERKRVEDALRESEARNRAMVDALPDLIFVQDRAGVYLDYHAKMSHLLITPPEFFLGRSTREILPPDQAEAFQQKSYLVFQTGEIQIHEYVLELADGIHHFEARMNAYDNDRLLSIVRDITERKLAEVELQYTKVGLEKANKELQTALAREKELAHTDALTGINNRRYLYELAEHEFEIALRYQQPLSILMFDIDHFKQVNDTFGHTAGDHILQQVTQAASAELRSADVIGRYGGEEFVIVLPMTNAQQAYPLAERIRLAAEAIRVPTEKGDASITLSIGIVEIRQGAQTGSVESLIRRADEVMYAAKQAGRNRTEIGG